MDTLRKILKHEMLQRKWNAYDLERESGVPQPTTQRFLSGQQREPKSNTIRRWAAAFNMTESQLRGIDERMDAVSNQNKNLKLPRKIDDEELIKIICQTMHMRFTAWSNIGIFLHVDEKDQEYRIMLIDKRQLKIPLDDNAFIIDIDTDNFEYHFKKGTQIVVNPIDNSQAKPGNTLLVSLSGHYTLVKYRPLAGKIFLETLESGYPKTIEIAPESPSNFTVHGLAIMATLASHLD